MIVCRTTVELEQALASLRLGKKVGFVPTMGALHQGHLSLIEASKSKCDITISSIYVNKAQFNNSNDFDKYPKDEAADCQLLESAGSDIVFIPGGGIFPDSADHFQFDFNQLDASMEGEFRPGHFKGVAMIIHEFFNLIRPDFAFFGLKDLQQVAIVSKLAKELHPETTVVPCQTIREEDGLAMSSRNRRLSSEARTHASNIPKALYGAIDLFQDRKPVTEIYSFVNEFLATDPLIELEYFQIVEQESLTPVSGDPDRHNYVACIAANVGGVRLIDNMPIIS